MGTVRKIGDEYYIEFFARGLKYQQKIGSDEARAQQALKEIEDKIAQGEAAIIVRDVDHDIFLRDFLEYSQGQHTPKTMDRYRSTVKDFSDYLRFELPTVKKLSEITPRVIEQYKSDLSRNPRRVHKNNPKIINLTLFLLRDILQYAIKLGYLNDNPTVHIRLVESQENFRPETLSSQEIEKLLAASSLDFRLALEVVLGTGMRWQEVTTLQWPSVDLANYCFKLLVPDAPSLGRRIIAMDIHLQSLVKEQRALGNQWAHVFVQRNHQPWTVSRLEQDLAQCVSQSGIKRKIHWHTLRHTFAVGLIRKRLLPSGLYKILGETDIGRVMIYHAWFQEQWGQEIHR